ncbi:hypothetical protein [Staphylococcus hominis]|nr:hypothetical protein [Staphylococcus hominis]
MENPTELIKVEKDGQVLEVTRKMYEVYYKIVGYELVKPKRSTKKASG